MSKLSPEELAEFLTQPTPRSVPKHLINSEGAVARIVIMAFGGVFMIAGLIMCYIFVPPRALQTIRMGFGEVAQAEGTIDACEDTIYSVGGSSRRAGRNSRRGTPVYRHEFSFEGPEGEACTGHSFATGRSRKPGSRVKIEYLKGSPAIARVVGMSLNPMGLMPSFVLLFPFIGFMAIALSWRSRRRRILLLRDGSFAFAHITKIQDTKLTINKQRVFEVTTMIDTETPPVEITTPARGEDVTLARQRMLDKEPIGVLYDPHRPKRALFTANLIHKR